MTQKSESIDALRYRRFMDGEDPEDIAQDDGVPIQIVHASIALASQQEQLLCRLQTMELQERGQLENEKFRQRVRDNLAPAAQQALAALLSGVNSRRTVNKRTGKVEFERIVGDPKVMAMGLRQYRKLASVRKGPVAAAIPIQIKNITVVNNTAVFGLSEVPRRPNTSRGEM